MDIHTEYILHWDLLHMDLEILRNHMDCKSALVVVVVELELEYIEVAEELEYTAAEEHYAIEVL